MSKDNKETKIEEGYRSMLQSIEDLVGEEGRNIKEAIDMAEQKLSEWGELGREEIESISKEVRQDIGSLGETVEEAKGSFREKWELDAKYLSDSTWDLLGAIADKTTLGIINFNKDLQDKLEEAKKDLHEREHKDHKTWHNDHEMWLHDVAAWEKEQQQNLQKLNDIQSSILAHAALISEHTEAIRAHEYIDKVHERDISREEQDPDNHILHDINDANEAAYENMKASHKDEAANHLKLKESQRKITLQINKLHKGLLHLAQSDVK